jgi:hypothetical protein
MKVALTGATSTSGLTCWPNCKRTANEAPVKTAKSFGLPIVHPTINVASGRERPTVPGLEGGT